MYKGKNWEILLPFKDLKVYGSSSLKIVRAPDVEYDPNFLERLEKVRPEAAKQVRAEKLIGFGDISEVDGMVSVHLRQSNYIDYKAMDIMAKRGDFVPKEYRPNCGIMTSVLTIDGKSMHSVRTSQTSSWTGLNSLFGCGLTGNDFGNADFLVANGVGKLTPLVAERIVKELGVEERDINKIELIGVVGEGRNKGCYDNIFAFKSHLGVESEKVLRNKGKVLSDPQISKKYVDLTTIDASQECIEKYLEANRDNILYVAEGLIVLTGLHLFGSEWINSLRAKGLAE